MLKFSLRYISRTNPFVYLLLFLSVFRWTCFFGHNTFLLPGVLYSVLCRQFPWEPYQDELVVLNYNNSTSSFHWTCLFYSRIFYYLLVKFRHQPVIKQTQKVAITKRFWFTEKIIEPRFNICTFSIFLHSTPKWVFFSFLISNVRRIILKLICHYKLITSLLPWSNAYFLTKNTKGIDLI